MYKVKIEKYTNGNLDKIYHDVCPTSISFYQINGRSYLHFNTYDDSRKRHGNKFLVTENTQFNIKGGKA